MFGLSLLDIGVVIANFAALIGIGFWSMKRTATILWGLFAFTTESI